MRGIEPRVDVEQTREAAREQHGRRDEDDRRGDFADKEDAAQPARAPGRMAAALLERRLQLEPRCVERGHRAEEDAGHEGNGCGECENAAVDRDVADARDLQRVERDETVRERVCDRDACSAADHRQQHRFGEELAGDASAARAEDGADRELLFSGPDVSCVTVSCRGRSDGVRRHRCAKPQRPDAGHVGAGVSGAGGDGNHHRHHVAHAIDVSTVRDRTPVYQGVMGSVTLAVARPPGASTFARTSCAQVRSARCRQVSEKGG